MESSTPKMQSSSRLPGPLQVSVQVDPSLSLGTFALG